MSQKLSKYIAAFDYLADLEINHEEFKTIVNEKEKYAKIKEDIGIMKNSDELYKEKSKKNINESNEIA